jgi:hypothetical protein
VHAPPPQKLRELSAQHPLNGKGRKPGAGLRHRLTWSAKVGGVNAQTPQVDEDKPLVLIQDCMRAASVRLAEGIESLVAREEERLRREIKEVRGPMQLKALCMTESASRAGPAHITIRSWWLVCGHLRTLT